LTATDITTIDMRDDRHGHELQDNNGRYFRGSELRKFSSRTA